MSNINTNDEKRVTVFLELEFWERDDLASIGAVTCMNNAMQHYLIPSARATPHTSMMFSAKKVAAIGKMLNEMEELLKAEARKYTNILVTKDCDDVERFITVDVEGCYGFFVQFDVLTATDFLQREDVFKFKGAVESIVVPRLNRVLPADCNIKGLKICNAF